MIVNENSFDWLKNREDNSIDHIITDPPYLIDFMGKGWDSEDNIAGSVDFWKEALRVCKSGSYAFVFGHSRTHHRVMVALENAGWEIRDCLMWLYGSGFPKSHNLGDGWGSALKPAYEPIIMVRKPFKGSLKNNVLEVKQVDLLGLDPDGNDVAVEIKCDFYPSDNWFVEFWDSGKHKDYWEKAKTQQVYFGGICNKSKKLHLYDLTKFRKEEVNKFSPVDSKYGTTGFLWNRTYNYNFKIGSFDLGI